MKWSRESEDLPRGPIDRFVLPFLFCSARRRAGEQQLVSRSSLECGTRQLDRTCAIQRQDWRLRKKPHQLLRRLGFGSIGVALLCHEGVVVQRSQQTAIVRPPERDV